MAPVIASTSGPSVGGEVSMTVSFNVQHAPMGAFSSFTVGHFNTRGGMASEIGRPGEENVYIGYLRAGDAEPRLFPFFEDAAGASATANFEVGTAAGPRRPGIPIAEAEIERDLSPAMDEWRAGPMTARVISPFFPIEDPRSASEEDQRRASCPAVFLELILDNRSGDTPLCGLFALEGDLCRDLSDHNLLGSAVRDRRGFACRNAEGVASFQEFDLRTGLELAGKRAFRLGRTAGLTFNVPPGQQRSLVIALGFYNAGTVTTGLPASYWYTRLFDGLEAVLEYALTHFELYRDEALSRAREIEHGKLNLDQRFLVAHSIHSYFGSTAWLDLGGEPVWVVAEGEYVMMNTLDLTIDQAFFELRYFPWAVKSELTIFAERYAYRDRVHRPGMRKELLPGGIAFCHDHGVGNQFSPPGHSAYEVSDLDAKCFSYMSFEEITNWVLTAGLYVTRTSDAAFLSAWSDLLRECHESLLNRDDPDPSRRTGIMGCDGARTGIGAEITTYDSLDASLGQARNNLYLAVKTWATHVTLAHLFGCLGLHDLATSAATSADRTARAVVARFDESLGYIPAVFEGKNQSAILPAIEALVYPKQMGLDAAIDPEGRYGTLIATLKRHFLSVFKPGVCQFPDGGWKLSSTSENTWISKIALAQYVARTVLGVPFSAEDRLREDRVHADWERVGSSYWACSDQFIAGKAMGSRYYPRIVTTILWLSE